MAEIFSHHPWTVDDLVSDVVSGQIRLPDLQRPFVWTNAKVRDLVDSMYRGYPVGELMFWAHRDASHTKQIGVGVKAQEGTMQVIDGQQRLTGLVAVVKGQQIWREDYTKERIRIAFNPMTGRFDVPTPVIEKSVEWISDIMTIFADPYGTRDRYFERLSADARKLSEVEKHQIEVALAQLHDLTRYRFQVVQVRGDISRQEVADIFVRINSEGVSLKSADFILTWLSVFWEEGRTQIERFARDSRFTPVALSQLLDEKVNWTPHNPYMALTPGQLIRVIVAYGLRRGRLSDAYNRLRGRDPRTREIKPERMEAELGQFKGGQEQALRPVHWDEFLKCLERAGFRSAEMITSYNTVLYTYVLWLMGRVEHEIPIDELREVIARWFFVAQLTGRYTNSPETQIQDELTRLDQVSAPNQKAFIAELEAMMTAAVPPDWWSVTLLDNLVTSSVKSPVFVAYVAALNILDAEVLLSNLRVRDWINPTRRPIRGIEKHHLFPKGYLKDLKITATRRINQIGNYAMVEWSDNNDISDDPPAKYWPAEVRSKGFNGERLARQMSWHALPDGWTQMGFDDFLKARRTLMAHIIQEGYKRLADPSYQPDLTPAETGEGGLVMRAWTLEELVDAGTLPPGTLLRPANGEGETVAQITDDGRIEMNEHFYDSPTAAAQDDGADTNDGWRYWVAYLDSGEILLDDLRPVPEAA